MWDVDFTGIGRETVTLLAATGVAAANEGHVAKISAAKTAGLCSAEDAFAGVIEKYDQGGGVVAMQRKGYREVAYTGSIAAGRRELVADGAGGVKPPSPGVKAFKVTGVEGDNNAILFTAKAYGTGGHDIRVQLKDPEAASQALAVDVVGKDIIVSLATGADTGPITSTAAEVIAAIEASAAAALVTAVDSGESSGAGVVAAVAIGALAGGVDPTAGGFYQVVDVDVVQSTLVMDLG